MGLELGLSLGHPGLGLGVSMGAVLGHLVLDATELGSGLGSDNLHLVGGPLAEGLVLVGELGSKLGAASLSLGASVVELLVELANGLFEVLTGLLGVRLDLASILGDVGVGLLDAVVEGSGHSGAGLLLGEHSSLKVLVGERLILGDLLAHLLGTLLVGVSTLVLLLGSVVELLLHEGHGVLKVVVGGLGIHGHLVEQELLHLGALGLVEGE